METPNVYGFEGFGDKTIMLVFYGTGVRISECLGIRHKDIDFDARTIYVWGKGRKSRCVPIADALVAPLREYLGEVEGIRDDEPIFRTNDFQRAVCANTIQERLREYGAMAGIKGVRCRPHVFRHTFAKHTEWGRRIYTSEDPRPHQDEDGAK